MKRILTTICITVLTTTLLAQNRTRPSGPSRETSNVCRSSFITGNLPYDSFMTFVCLNQESTIDGFLKKLASNSQFSPILKAKSLAYKSRSRHESSFENPRALLMYGNGDLVVTFNGGQNQSLYDSLEVMGYNQRSATFEFREIKFKNDRGTARPTEQLPEHIGTNQVSISRVNPFACMECHNYGGYIRPNWDSYLAWRGVYGSFEESFELPRARFARASMGTEWKKLTDFQATSNHPERSRYGHFNWGNEDSSFHQLSATYFGILLNFRMAHSALQNALDALLKPENSKYKYAFAGYMMNCSNQMIKEQGSLRADTPAGLASRMSDVISHRAKRENFLRKEITKDHEEFQDPLVWRQFGFPALPFSLSFNRNIVSRSELSERFSPLAVGVAISERQDTVFRLARLENLFEKMGLTPEMLYLEGKTSWDGYNEVIDFMSDYVLKYYGLPLVTPENKVRAEKGIKRHDLDAPAITSQDYHSIATRLNQLQMMPTQGASQDQLCRQLGQLSLEQQN